MCSCGGGSLFLHVGEAGGCLASMVNMGVASEKINGKRCGGPTKCKGNVLYMPVHF